VELLKVEAADRIGIAEHCRGALPVLV